MMSLEDNEKLRWGEAAVRVPTCIAKGREAEGSWDEGELTRQEEFIKGGIYDSL